jgi:hypothetical protein
MVERGAHHNKALWVVAGHLAERAWVTLLRQQPYVLRDLEGKPISVAQGEAIIAEHFTVPEDVRRRSRTKKKKSRKAPQVLEARIRSVSRGDDKRGDLRRGPASPSTRRPSTSALVTS